MAPSQIELERIDTTPQDSAEAMELERTWNKIFLPSAPG